MGALLPPESQPNSSPGRTSSERYPNVCSLTSSPMAYGIGMRLVSSCPIGIRAAYSARARSEG